MANPWDPLPLPRDADLDEKVTFEGIGRVIDLWERIELTLSRVHSVFLGSPDGGPEMRKYGAGRTLPDRIAIIREAAEKWAETHHNQKQEGEFDRLMTEVLGFSDRRNEIAHGIVHPVSTLERFRVLTTRPDYRVQYAVIPAYHVMKRYIPGGVPKYMYAEPEMTTIRDRLTVLYVALGDYLHEIDPI